MLASSFLRRRTLSRIGILIASIILFRLLFVPRTAKHEIRTHNVLERVTRPDKTLDVNRHPFLQVRMGRDERDGMLSDMVQDGVQDYWERFQFPFMTARESSRVDIQVVRSSIEDLLAMNGWVTAACSTLSRPFGQDQREEAWDELLAQNHLYYIAIVIHAADHFLIDQLAVIVQMARRLGPQNLFVSMLDYDSSDATPTLLDLCEAVLTLLAVPFRIRHVPRMTEEPTTAYYPMEEAYTRNLALEPLWELRQRRGMLFHRVIWLKGFTCPTDVLETIKVSQANEAAMVCGMDWAEHNGFFIFSDRWRTRDMDGDQFRRSKSSAKPEAAPPRDKVSAARYAQHLPFQVFCCESGTHVVDPAHSYYRGIHYRHATNFFNLTNNDAPTEWDPQQPCMDSTQAWFCRDLWVDGARDGMRDERSGGKADPVWIRNAAQKREADPQPQPQGQAQGKPVDGGAAEAEKAGSDLDAMPEGDAPLPPAPAPAPESDDATPYIPNSAFRPARILINPRCVTTYAGVSHAQLALDLFGPRDGSEDELTQRGKYVLEDWEGAPDSFVCQEQRQTGGRKASKSQRRLSFNVHKELKGDTFF